MSRVFPPPDPDDEYPEEFFCSEDGVLRTLVRMQRDFNPLVAWRLERTDSIQAALDRMCESQVSGGLADEAAVRLAALHIVWETVGRGGLESLDLVEDKQVRDALDVLRNVFECVLLDAAAMDEFTRKSGIELRPASPGGGKVKNPRRGPRSFLLTEIVRELLQDMYPDWEPKTALPEGNTDGVRVWLYTRLWALTSFERAGFSLEAIDPEPGGALETIINNLQRRQKRQTVGPRRSKDGIGSSVSHL